METENRTNFFYVIAITYRWSGYQKLGQKEHRIMGPFETRKEASDRVLTCQGVTIALNSAAEFWEWGILREWEDRGPGILSRHPLDIADRDQWARLLAKWCIDNRQGATRKESPKL